MKMPKLTKTEKNLLESYENDEWTSIVTNKHVFQKYQDIAKASFKKDKRINIRISTKDLEDIQKTAIKEGIPYQTLVASIIHKFNTGSLIEIKKNNYLATNQHK